MILSVPPMLFPYQPKEFWKLLRQIICEEMADIKKEKIEADSRSSNAMLVKPLYKMSEICAMFHVTKPTIYK